MSSSDDDSDIRLSEYHQPGSNAVDFAFSVTPPTEEVGETTITVAGSDDPRYQARVNPALAGETTITVAGDDSAPPEANSSSEGTLLLADYEEEDPQNLVFQFGSYSDAEPTVPTTVSLEGGDRVRAHGSTTVGEGGAVAISSDHGEYPLAPLEHPIIESVGTTTTEGRAPTVDVLSYGGVDGGRAGFETANGEYPLAPLENPAIKAVGQTELVTGYTEERGEFEYLPDTDIRTYDGMGGGRTVLLDRHPLAELSEAQLAEHTLTDAEEDALAIADLGPVQTPTHKWWRDGPFANPTLGGQGGISVKTGAEWDDEDDEWIEFEHTPTVNVLLIEPDPEESPLFPFRGTIFMRGDRVWRPDELEEMDAEERAEALAKPLHYLPLENPVAFATAEIEHTTGDEGDTEFEHVPDVDVLTREPDPEESPLFPFRGTIFMRGDRVWRPDELEALREADHDPEEIEEITAKPWFYFPASDPAPASIGWISHRTGDERIIDEDGEVTDRWNRYAHTPRVDVLTREPADPALFTGTMLMADRRVWRPDEIETLREAGYDDEEIAESTAKASLYGPLENPALGATGRTVLTGYSSPPVEEGGGSGGFSGTRVQFTPEPAVLSGRGVLEPTITLRTEGDPGMVTPPIPVQAGITLATAHDRWPLSTNANPVRDVSGSIEIGSYPALVRPPEGDATVTVSLEGGVADALSEPLFRTRVRLTPEAAKRPDEGFVPAQIHQEPTSPLTAPALGGTGDVILEPGVGIQLGWQPVTGPGPGPAKGGAAITLRSANVAPLAPLASPSIVGSETITVAGASEGVTADTEPVGSVGITLAGEWPLQAGVERGVPAEVLLDPAVAVTLLDYGTSLDADNEFVLQPVHERGHYRLATAPLDDEPGGGASPE